MTEAVESVVLVRGGVSVCVSMEDMNVSGFVQEGVRLFCFIIAEPMGCVVTVAEYPS